MTTSKFETAPSLKLTCQNILTTGNDGARLIINKTTFRSIKIMIDFKNGSFFKLSPVNSSAVLDRVSPLLIEGEVIMAAFKTFRDSVIFTDKRVIAINVQGIMGKKVDFTSLPYSKVQAFSVETAGTFDLDCELDLFFSGLGVVRFEIKGNYDIRQLSQIIATYTL